MSRPLVLSNGKLMVGLDENGLVHDFYYPYVGLDNLTTARSIHHKIGVWIDGVFSWIDDGTWTIEWGLEESALVSNVYARSNSMQVEIIFNDFVDSTFDIFVRRASVKNNSNSSREIRLFFHQVFQISRGGRNDTAIYVPDPKYLYTYKGKIGLLSYCRSEDNGFDQFAVGSYGVENKAGTYVDAEDGVLSGSTVEHGGVDSVLGITVYAKPSETKKIDYWTIASDSHDAQFKCEEIHKKILSTGIDERAASTRRFWEEWLGISQKSVDLLPHEYQILVKKSLMLIKAHTDYRGAVLASGDSSIFNYGRDYYCYCWPRDAAFALWPLLRLGYTKELKQFFIFCRDVVSPKGYLMHKYLPDRSIGSTWHSLVNDGENELAIQEDESAIILFMLREYLETTDDIEFVSSLYEDFIQPVANFLERYIDTKTNLPHASYDLWEEKFITATYTVAITEKALYSAADIALQLNHPDDAMNWRAAADKIKASYSLLINPDSGQFRKGLRAKSNDSLEFDETLDSSSMYGMLMFSEFANKTEYIKNTAAAIEKELLVPSLNAVARYKNDGYFKIDPNSPGNPWIVCTLWLAQYYIHSGSRDKAIELIDRVVELALGSGVLSEQINPANGAPVGVAPLVWSHAEFINTVLDLNQ